MEASPDINMMARSTTTTQTHASTSCQGQEDTRNELIGRTRKIPHCLSLTLALDTTMIEALPQLVVIGTMTPPSSPTVKPTS